MTDFLNFHDWVSEAAKANRPEVIEGVLPAILAVASDEEIRTLTRNFGYMADKNFSDEVLSALLSRLAPNEMGAMRFMTSRLKDQNLSRVHMDMFLSHLGEAAGACLLNCLYSGEYDLAQRIVRDYPSEFPVEVITIRGIHVKDYEVECRGEAMSGFQGPADIKHCFEMLLDTAVIAPSNDGSNAAFYWVADADKQKHSLECLSGQFDGEIPVLSGNVLSSPELALALTEARDAQAQFKDIYSHFPAWVRTSEVSGYEGLIAFRNEVQTTWGAKDPQTIVGLAQYGQLRVSDFPVRYGNEVQTGINALNAVDVGLVTDLPEWEHNLYHRYLEHFVPDFTLLGLEKRSGMTLALIPLDALSQIEMSPVSTGALSTALAFVGDFFPLDVLINRKIQGSDFPPRCEKKVLFSAAGAIGLLNTLAGSPHKEALYEIFPKQMIHDAFSFANFHVTTQALIDLDKRYGWKPETPESRGFVEMEIERVQELFDAGYELWADEARTVRRPIKFKRYPDQGLPILQLLKMGGSVHGQALPTIEGALRNITRRDSAIFEKAYLQYLGPVEVAKVARTPGDWSTFMALFSQDEKQTALELIPAKRREEFFAGDLGL